jgi:hypothetical protein
MSNRLSGPVACLLFPVTAAMMVFILAPLLVTVAISFSDTPYVVFPPRGFTMSWYAKVLQDSDFQTSLSFSIVLAVGATSGALLLGVPAAFAVARHQFPGRGAAAAMLLSPLVFPVLITGVALLQLFATLHSDSTPLNMLIAHVLVTMPYVVRTVAASLMLADTNLEDAARGRGALARVPPHHGPTDRAWPCRRRVVRVHGFVRQFPHLVVAGRCAAQSDPASGVPDDRQHLRALDRRDLDPDDPAGGGHRDGIGARDGPASGNGNLELAAFARR